MNAPSAIHAVVHLPDGTTDETGRGLLSFCGRLAGFLGAPWGAVTAAAPGNEALDDLGRYGTAGVCQVAGADRFLDLPAHLGRVLAGAFAADKAPLVVLPHDDLGSTLAPVIAAALDAALLTEVTGVRRGDDGVRLSRPALGGRVAETKVWDAGGPLVITVALKALSQVLLPNVRRTVPLMREFVPEELPAVPAARVTERIPADPQTVDLTEAEVIFSAGKGCDAATFAQLKELCLLLNVSFGVTRPVYDYGWTGFERMVGQTGRTVTPKLYVALGISGSMHHVGGIKDSRRIVAVNADPKAPIFPNSDEGFVADLREVLPLLVERAQQTAGGAA